jgi:hypothetical protein
MADTALIAKLDISLRGNTQNLDSALDTAGVGLGRFRQRVQQQTQAANTNLNQLGNGVSSAFQNALTNPIAALSSIGTGLLSAVLHPISTAKTAISSFIDTSRNVGNSILSIFAPLSKFTGLTSVLSTVGSLALGLVKPFLSLSGVVTYLGADLAKTVMLFSPLAAAIGQSLMPIAPLIIASIGQIGNKLSSLASAAKPVVVSLAVKGWDAIKAGFAGVKDSLGGLAGAAKYLVAPIPDMFRQVAAESKDILGNIGKAKPVVLSVFSTGWASIKTALASVYGAVKPIVLSVVSSGWTGIKTALASVYNSIKPIVLNPVSTGWAGIKTALASVYNSIKPIVLNPVSTGWTSIKTALASVYGAAKPIVLNPVSTGWTSIKTALASVYGAVKPIVLNVASSGWTSIRTALASVYAAMKPIVLSVVSSGWAGIKTALASVYGAVKPIVLNPVSTGWASIKTALASVYGNIKPIVLSVVSSGWTGIKTALASVYGNIKPIVLSVFSTGWTFIKTALASVYDSIKPIVLSVFSTGWTLIRNALVSIYGSIKPLVLNVVSSGWAGIKAALNALYKMPSLVIKFTSSGLDGIKTGIKNLFSSLTTPKLNTSNITGASNAISGLTQSATSAGGGLAQMGAGASEASGGLLSMMASAGPVAIAIGAVAIAAIATVGAVLGLAAAGLHLANQQAPVIANMQKLASTLNMSTESFSALASVGGMDVETFSGGLTHLQSTLSDAAENGGQVAAMLQRVGLNARDLAHMPVEEQMRRLAPAFQNVTNQADRLRLATELVGRGNAMDFTRMLQNGTAGLDAMQQRAERFGLTFTESQAETVRRSNKVWGEWSLGLQGIGRSLAVAFAPAWEYLGTVLGNFFGKIAQWVKASLPYLEMLWTVTKEVLDDIGDALSPLTSWFTSSVEDMGSALGGFVMGSVPFIREGWNIIKAITSVTWDAIVGIYNAAVDFIKPLVTSMVETVKGWFGSLSDFLTGETASSWDTFKDMVLKVMITMEFIIKNFADVATVVWHKIQLTMLEWVEGLGPVVTGFQNFINLLIDGFNALSRGLARTVGATINGLIDSYNSVVDVVGGDRIDFHVDVDATQLQHVNLAVANVGETIRELRETIAEEMGAISTDLMDFVDQRMAELNRMAQAVQNQASQQQQTQGSTLSKVDNAATLAGSKEAYSIIAGAQGDKQFNALNDILAQLRRDAEIQRQQLDELRNRPNIAVARV